MKLRNHHKMIPQNSTEELDVLMQCYNYVIRSTGAYFKLAIFKYDKQTKWIQAYNLKAYSTAHYSTQLISGSGAVSLRFRLIEISSLFHHVFRYLRTLCIVWSLVRRRVTRRLTRLQTMCNALKNRKILKTDRCGCGSVAVISSIYLCSVL